MSLFSDGIQTMQYSTANNKLMRMTTMTRAAATKPEMEAVPTQISNSGATWSEVDPKQSFENPSDLQNSGCCPSLRTGTGKVDARPKEQDEQDWTSTHTSETLESPSAAGGIFRDSRPCIGAKGQGNLSAERKSGLEMKTCALSRIHASPSARHDHSPVYGAIDQDSCSLQRPNSRRCRSWFGTQSACDTSTPRDRTQSRRWSMGGSAGGGLQYAADETGSWVPTVDIATVRRWCDEFQETRVAEWQQTVTEFGQTWKRWCFVQQQARSWQDNLIKEAIKNFWQPLSDFDYVLSVYSFLEGVRNPNLLPHLRRTYMTWRLPEQTRFHEGCGLRDEDDGSSNIRTPSDSMSRDNESRATASKYPLTIHQHLRVARICDDVAAELKSLQHWLDEFQGRREACARASQAGLSNAVMAECRWKFTDSAREFSSLAKLLTKYLRDSRRRLCEALGLDPKRVPGGDTITAPTMTAMKYEKAAHIRRTSPGRPALSRKFRLKMASLQASRIALKANLYMTVMPCKIAQRLLERMMVRSTEMATMAVEAGDYKAEATMHRLHNKIRKVSERAGQEYPDVKPKMTLLDSETWPAVLNPRKDMQVEVHGHISTPVETLIDMLLSPQDPVSLPGSNKSGNGNRRLDNSITTTSEYPPSEQASGQYQSLNTANPTMAIPEAKADKT